MATTKKRTTAAPDVDAVLREAVEESAARTPTAELIALAELALRLDADADRLTSEAAEAAGRARKIRDEQLPPMMDTLTLRAFTLSDGTTVTRAEEVYASVSKENLAAAADWLTANGYGALVKAKITVEMEKGDDTTAKAARTALAKARVGYEESFAIHPATLRSFARESIEAGRPLPPSITHHVQPTAKLAAPKVRKIKAARAV